MAFQLDLPPASSQLSSILSNPPSSDNEGLGEITVDLNTTSTFPSPHSNTHNDTPDTTKMPVKVAIPEAGARPKRQSQRQSKNKPLYGAASSDNGLEGQRQVSPSIVSKSSSIPAKRNRPDSTTKPTPKPAAKRTKPAVVRRVKKWEPEFVTQNTKSPLVTHGVDLRALLLQPAAWDVLSAEDKREILSFFPADVHILDPGTPNARPNVGSLCSNDTFRHDAEEYVSNIAKGMHDPEWLQQAWAAHQRRAMGDFDEFYIRKVEVDWSTDIPDDHRPEHLRTAKSGASASSSSGGRVSASSRPAEVTEKKRVSAGGVLEQKGSAEDLVDTSTSSDSGHTPGHTTPNGSSGIADSITVRYGELSRNNDGPRFEVIPSSEESDVDQAPDQENTNGTGHGVGHGIPVGVEAHTG